MRKPGLSGNVKTHKGRFKPKNPSKYLGDSTKIYYRSSWERYVMIWADISSNILAWGSEEVVIPYLSVVDGKRHNYFIDFVFRLKDSKQGPVTLLVDVKPDKQTRVPSRNATDHKSRRNRMKEIIEYGRNISKWDAARMHAQKNGYLFEIWTEKVLARLGIM